MQTDEFVRRVQEQANIESGDEALEIVAATLETLGERLPRDERADLTAELPGQLKAYARRRLETEQFTLEEFYNRVAARSGLGAPAAVQQTHVVMQVLQEAVSEGQLQDMRAQLPPDFEELFTGEPQGPGSPAAQ